MAADEIYTVAYTEAAGTCTTHTEAPKPVYDPSSFNPLNPATWPTDPSFNIFDPTTWPNHNTENGGGTDTPEPTQTTDPGGEPSPTPGDGTTE